MCSAVGMLLLSLQQGSGNKSLVRINESSVCLIVPCRIKSSQSNKSNRLEAERYFVRDIVSEGLSNRNELK